MLSLRAQTHPWSIPMADADFVLPSDIAKRGIVSRNVNSRFEWTFVNEGAEFQSWNSAQGLIIQEDDLYYGEVNQLVHKVLYPDEAPPSDEDPQEYSWAFRVTHRTMSPDIMLGYNSEEGVFNIWFINANGAPLGEVITDIAGGVVQALIMAEESM